MKKIKNFTQEELFDDFKRLYETFKVLNKTLYQKYGKYSSKELKEMKSFLILVQQYNKKNAINIKIEQTQFIPQKTERILSNKTKQKISQARINNRKGDVSFTKEFAIKKGVQYWEYYLEDFSEKEFLSANNFNKGYFRELFHTFTEFKKLLPCWDEIFQKKCENALKAKNEKNYNYPTKEEILEKAKELFNEKGVLMLKDLRKSLVTTDAHIQRCVGKLTDIKQALNINTTPAKYKHDEFMKNLFESELKRIYQLYKTNNVEKFTMQYFFNHADSRLTHSQLKKYYKTFASFTKTYGIMPYQNEYTKESILETSWELYRTHGKLNAAIHRKVIPQSAVDRLFGGFNGLLKEMGLKLNMPRGITKEDVLEDLSSIVKKYGVLSEAIIINESKYSFPTILTLFDRSLENLYNELNIMTNLPSQASQTGTYCIIKIAEILNEKPEFEKTFDWLKNKSKMFLDGYFKNLSLAIEYDGPYHYTEFLQKFRTNMVSEVETNDQIKDLLCKEHGIKLIRISYKESLSTENLKNILIKNGIKF